MSRRERPPMAVRTAALSVTSNGSTRARLPRPAISSATASSSAGVRLFRITSAPAFASASAIARPMPRPAPVTSAILPSSRKALSGEGTQTSQAGVLAAIVGLHHLAAARQADITATEAFRPIHLVDRAIRPLARRGQILSEPRDTEHPPAIGQEALAVAFRAGVENLDLGVARRGIEAAD